MAGGSERCGGFAPAADDPDMEQTRYSHELLEQIVTRIDGETLRQLAAIADARHRSQLTAEGVVKMCELIEAGKKPTLGFYRRYATPPAHEPVLLVPPVEHQHQQ